MVSATFPETGQTTMDSFMGGAGLVSKITNMVNDLVTGALQDRELHVYTDDYAKILNSGLSGQEDLGMMIQSGLAKDPGYPFMSDVYNMLTGQIEAINVALHGGMLGGTGSTMAQYVENLCQTGTLLSIYKNTAFAVGTAPWVLRHYRSMYSPNEPGAEFAFRMERRGQINRAEFGGYANREGWAPKYLDKLYNTFTRMPDPWFAFSMYKRGLVNLSKMSFWLRDQGYDDSDLQAILQGLYKNLSLGELIRISDFVELSSTYIGSCLRGAGYLDSDIPILTTALQKRPNREEVRGMTTELIWMYQHGRISLSELGSAFDGLGLLPTEKSLDLQQAELKLGQQLIQEALQVVEYRVEGGDPAVQSISDIKTAIMDLGVNEETSNLLAEQYYYHYVYKPA